METVTRGIRLPEEKTYLARLSARAERTMERWRSHPLLTDPARGQAALLLASRLEAVAGSAMQSMWEQRMTEKNPLLPWDVRLATREEKDEAAQSLLNELEESDDRALLERRPLLRGELERTEERFERWLRELLDRVEPRRADISGAFFGGGDFGPVTGLTAGQAGLHFHGRSAAVVRTEKGPFLYKPHDCGLDDFYSRLVRRWFSDVTRVPRVVTGEGYGFCEFIAGETPGSREDLAAYFANFGGLCALFQALGSTDLHWENFIAHGRYPVLVDMETLFTPTPRAFNDPAVFPEPPSRQEGFTAGLSRSLYPSGLLPGLWEDTQTSPLLAPSLPALWGWEEEFFAGFSKIYDRCVEIREPLGSFLREAEALPVRVPLRQSAYYGRQLKRLRSPEALSGPEVRESLSARLGEYFQRRGAGRLQPIADWEASCLREGDIPYFSCRGDGVDLLGYGQAVAESFFRQSPLDSAGERLERMSRREKQFELTLPRQSLGSAPRPVSEEKRIPLPAAEEAEQPLGKAEALAQAEELCRIVPDQLCRYLRPLEKARRIPEEVLPLGLSAGAAGLLQVLCGYRELRSHPLSPKLMADCADRLLAAKTLKTASGTLLWDTLDLGRPVSGMGHGTAGIGASLRMAGVLLHREECLLAAGEALDWEYQAYSERLGAWPGFRESSLGEHAMHSYCSGAPGMGLAMLLYGEWEESGPLQRENLSRAFDACRRFPPPPPEEQALQMFPSSPMATAWDMPAVHPGM